MNAPDTDLRTALRRLFNEEHWRTNLEDCICGNSDMGDDRGAHLADVVLTLLAEHQPTAREADGAGQVQAHVAATGDTVCPCSNPASTHFASVHDDHQPAPVASAPAAAGDVDLTALTEGERMQLQTVIAEGYYDHTIDYRAAKWFERILAARLAEAEQRVVESQAVAWDEGHTAGSIESTAALGYQSRLVLAARARVTPSASSAEGTEEAGDE